MSALVRLAVARLLAAAAFALVAGTLHAQETSPALTTVVQLRDGSRIVGTLERVDDDSIIVRGTMGRVAIARGDVERWRTLSATESGNGRFTLAPHTSRLVFGPTARVQVKGDAYIANHYLFLFDGSAGIGHNASLGGGLSIVPALPLTDNLFFLLPKFGVIQSDKFNVAVGALAGRTSIGDGVSLGIAYAVATIGPPARSVTVGAGLGYVNGDWARRPAIMVGGEFRTSNRLAFVTENYAFPGFDGALVSLVFRIYGERISGDLGLMAITGSEGASLPIPVVGLAIRF